MRNTKTDKAALKKAFNDGSLLPKNLGNFIELVLEYRGFYIDEHERARWAGPWRSDQGAAIADTLPYTKQFETGIRIRQS